MASATPCGLILLGNSGVGKSFLANRLLDDDNAFESKFSAKSVTRYTEWKDMPVAIENRIYSVANIPGLVEANQRLVDENRHEIMKAFEQCPFSIVIFVFGHKNGRIPDEDLVAFTRINNAYEFSPRSLLIIVNGIPSDRPDDYETRTAYLLHELTHVDVNHIYFIEKTTSEESKKFIHKILHKALTTCEPSHQTKKQDIVLITDEISQLKAQSKQRQDQLLTQAEEHSKIQKIDLTPDSYQELPQGRPTLSFTETFHPDSAQKLQQGRPTLSYTEMVHPDSQCMEQDDSFNELLKTHQNKFDRSSGKIELLLHDPDRDARIRLAEQIKQDSERNKQMIAQMSVPPQVIVISDKRSNPLRKIKHGFGKVVNYVGDVFHGPESYHSPAPDGNEQGCPSYPNSPLSPHPYDPRSCGHKNK
ncbi:unnamed protein product [Rotaria sp. Silwood2]|nr:unnamed protein product [Rotaria sp. Silwood2]CAF4267052.1 unnamed protein product [Rotaria sp. Silwood2]